TPKVTTFPLKCWKSAMKESFECHNAKEKSKLMPFKTEIEFTLPRGFLDSEGTLHKDGVMRLATAADEILPQKDPRVQANPAYLTIIVLSRVVTRLGSLPDVNPRIVE